MNACPEPILFLPMTASMRLRLEATIENLIALLDEVDGDPDIEPEIDDNGDDEPTGDEMEDDARDWVA